MCDFNSIGLSEIDITRVERNTVSERDKKRSDESTHIGNKYSESQMQLGKPSPAVHAPQRFLESLHPLSPAMQ